MDDNMKGILFLGTIAGGIFLLSKLSAGQGGIQGAATVSMSIRKAGGLSGISAEIGDDLIAGDSYVLTTTVTNQSTRAGLPVAADLVMAWGGNVVNSNQSASFGVGETKSFNVPFTVPLGLAGSTAQFSVAVKAPSGLTVASDSIQGYVQSPSINYAASVVLGY